MCGMVEIHLHFKPSSRSSLICRYEDIKSHLIPLHFSFKSSAKRAIDGTNHWMPLCSSRNGWSSLIPDTFNLYSVSVVSDSQLRSLEQRTCFEKAVFLEKHCHIFIVTVTSAGRKIISNFWHCSCILVRNTLKKTRLSKHTSADLDLTEMKKTRNKRLNVSGAMGNQNGVWKIQYSLWWETKVVLSLSTQSTSAC